MTSETVETARIAQMQMRCELCGRVLYYLRRPLSDEWSCSCGFLVRVLRGNEEKHR